MLFTYCVSQIAARFVSGYSHVQGKQRLLQAGTCNYRIPVGVIERVHGVMKRGDSVGARQKF